MLAKAAHLNGLKPWDRQLSDELQQDKERRSGKSPCNAPRGMAASPQSRPARRDPGSDPTARLSAVV